MDAPAWSRGLEVTGGGTGVVSHAGLVLLRQLCDRTVLTARLSSALPTPDGGLDRGRVFADLACATADGARVISDFRVMSDRAEAFGQVALVPTAWRALKETAAGGDGTRRKIAVAMCPHNPKSPRDAAAHPGHVRAATRDTVIYAAIDAILSGLLGHDRAAAYGAQIPVTQADADARTTARVQQLQRDIAQADTAINGLMTQLEQLGSDSSPAAAAYRDRIREQFTSRYDQKAAAQAELDALLATRPPAEDPTLIDELPYAAELLHEAPADLRARIYAAFDVHALYRADKNQATITAKITDATPQLIQALLDNPRTDHDTHDPARTNLPISAIGNFSFVIMVASCGGWRRGAASCCYQGGGRRGVRAGGRGRRRGCGRVGA